MAAGRKRVLLLLVVVLNVALCLLGMAILNAEDGTGKDSPRGVRPVYSDSNNSQRQVLNVGDNGTWDPGGGGSYRGS
jgi:hypothetical protein